MPRALLAAIGPHLHWNEGTIGYLPGNWNVPWSLAIEEVFHIGFLVICLLVRLVLPLACLAVSMPWMDAALAGNGVWQEKASLPEISAVAIGVIGALLSRRWQRSSMMQAR